MVLYLSPQDLLQSYRDNTDQICGEEHDSAPHGTDVAMGSVEEAQADKAPNKTVIVPVLQLDISTRALIIIFIVIGIQVVLLPYLQNHL